MVEFGICSSEKYICKHYPSLSERDLLRLEVEFSTLEFLSRNGLSNIPKPLFCNENHNFAVYSFIEGSFINACTKGQHGCLDFLTFDSDY